MKPKVDNQAQQLTVALQQTRKDYKALTLEYNKLVAEHNHTVDKVSALMGFLQIQCGVLYTAITNETQVDEPMKEISSILIRSVGDRDLNYLRNSIMTYIKTFMIAGDPEEAFAAYQLFILEEK